MNEEDLLDAYHGRHPYSYGSRKGVKTLSMSTTGNLKQFYLKVKYIQVIRSLKNQNLHHLSEPMVAIIFGKQT